MKSILITTILATCSVTVNVHPAAKADVDRALPKYFIAHISHSAEMEAALRRRAPDTLYPVPARELDREIVASSKPADQQKQMPE